MALTIDSHQHFWKYSKEEYGWIDDSMAVLQKDFLPADLAKIYSQLNIDGCVAVQARTSEEETQFLLNLANHAEFVKGVVGWLELRDATISSKIESYASETRLKGLRHVLQGEPQDDYMLQPDFVRGIGVLQKYNLTYDILIFPRHLPYALELVKKFPNQKFIIDHIAKPYIKDGLIDEWAKDMKVIAQIDNVWCKVSGMVTEANWKTWQPTDITPYMDVVFDAFDTNRILYGSDWPVCTVAGTYEQTYHLFTEYIQQLSANEQAKVLGTNAIEFYNL